METVNVKDVVVKANTLNSANMSQCTTVLLTRFPYTLIQELSTHRVLNQDSLTEVAGSTSLFTKELSRNSGSSRAIPIRKVIDQVMTDPFIPTFTKNQKGMGGVEEFDNFDEYQRECTELWLKSRDLAVETAQEYIKLNTHKQHVNDILKPYMRIPVIITATEWDNFIKLRTDKACRVEFRAWAIQINKAIKTSPVKVVSPGEWHIPFAEDIEELSTALMVSAARCARASYNTHDGKQELEEHFRLYNHLLESRHMSVFEHQVLAVDSTCQVNTRNLKGFISHRALIELKEWYKEINFDNFN